MSKCKKLINIYTNDDLCEYKKNINTSYNVLNIIVDAITYVRQKNTKLKIIKYIINNNLDARADKNNLHGKTFLLHLTYINNKLNVLKYFVSIGFSFCECLRIENQQGEADNMRNLHFENNNEEYIKYFFKNIIDAETLLLNKKIYWRIFKLNHAYPWNYGDVSEEIVAIVLVKIFNFEISSDFKKRILDELGKSKLLCGSKNKEELLYKNYFSPFIVLSRKRLELLLYDFCRVDIIDKIVERNLQIEQNLKTTAEWKTYLICSKRAMSLTNNLIKSNNFKDIMVI